MRLPWFLNGTLPPAEHRLVREHLLGCAACRSELAEARRALGLFVAASTTRVAEAPRGLGDVPEVATATSIDARGGERWTWAAVAALLVFVASGAIWQASKMPSRPGASPSAEEPGTAPHGQSREAAPIFSDGFDEGDAKRWTLKS